MSISVSLIQECLDSCNAVDSPNNTDVVPGVAQSSSSSGASGFTLLPDALGALAKDDVNNDGFFAQAYIDPSGNIIIAYEQSEPTIPNSAETPYQADSTSADIDIFKGQEPKALSDAVAFAKDVETAAFVDGDALDPIYVTGFSLGGTEAEAAAEALNISAGGFISGSATFASTGLPDYKSPGGNNDFLNFVDTGDPVGNYAQDSVSELNSLSNTGSHFGTVQLVGTAAGADNLSFALGAAKGNFNFTEAASMFFALATEYHNLENYDSDLHSIDQEIEPLAAPVLISNGTPTVNPAPAAIDPGLGFLLTGQAAGTPPRQSSNPFPVVDNLSSAPAQTGSFTLVSNWFSAAETNSAGGHSITGYNLFMVSGSGSLIVNGLPYALGSVATNISPAEFATAYFDAGSTPGVSEIAVIAIDDLGNYSVAGDLTVSVSAPAAPPQPINATDTTPPTIVSPSAQAVTHVGGSLTLTSNLLEVTDSNISGYTASQLTYTITSTPEDGYLLKNGSIVSSFTQSDINNGLIEYQENGTTASSDQFSYYVSDPAGNRTSGTTFNIQIQPPPSSTSPTLTADSPLSVGQGLSGLITDANLDVTDSGVNSWQIIYTLANAPSGGQIIADGVEPVTYFTQQQVELGLISYKNDGNASGPDSFTFTVSDGMGGSIGQTAFDINVIPTNNLTVNVGRPLYVSPGALPTTAGTNTPGYAALITPQMLSASDPGVDPANIVYTVNSLPADGYDILVGSWGTPSGSSHPFNPIREIIPNGSGGFYSGGVYGDYFTQAEVNAGEVFYVPVLGSTVVYGAVSSMTLTVSDGVGNSVPNIILPVQTEGDGLLSDGTYTPISSLPSVTPTLTATIGGSTVIGSGLLTFVSPQFADFQITYSLDYAPTYGALYVNGVPFPTTPSGVFSLTAPTFTQQEINEGLVTYVENGAVVGSDRFGLFVSDPNSPSNNPEGILNIDVTMTGANGGEVLSGSTGDESLSPGVGNNYLFGDGNTTADYANSPNGIVANLATGSVSNGYGGTDTLTNIHSIIGSAYDDTFIAGDPDTFTGGGGEDTFEGVAANLNGSTITDLTIGDKIVITDANLAHFSFQQGSASLTFDPDTSVSQTSDLINLPNMPAGQFAISADPVSGVDLTFVPSYVFTTIDEPQAGTTFTVANGINDQGQIVGTYSGGTPDGFLDDGGTFTTIDDPAATSGTQALGINNAGQIVGVSQVSGNGQIVVRGFLYSDGAYTPISDPYTGGPVSYAQGINDGGQIVGYYFDGFGGEHGFLYNAGVYTTIDDPLASDPAGAQYAETRALGINDAGQIVGFYTDSAENFHGFLDVGGTFTTIDDPLAGTAANEGTFATGINASGQIVGYYDDANGVGHGFIDNGGSFTTIDDPNATIGTTAVQGINDAGQIVGSYEDGEGAHGFTADIACYCAGTRILAARGDVAVEDLRIGDLLLTASGVLRPIKWIGTRAYSARFAGNNPDLLPIRFNVGSLAENVPARDLLVSPHHAMFLDGVLIPAEHLVNGATIVQKAPGEDIHYFHIELDSHDVLIAEGALSESFVDDDSRGIFQNASTFAALYPRAARQEAAYCAPRVDDGFALDRLRRRLAERAGLAYPAATDFGMLLGVVEHCDHAGVSGWALNTAYRNAPVCLDVIVDGALIGYAYAEAAREKGGRRFNLRFAPALDPSRPHEIELRRSADGARLAKTLRLDAQKSAA
ncbi:cadherin-like domain-containing protein [Rhodoblastus sp.]|uniref:cadherin-like domain-containing protein n=1 Tax=Rhodoblastus sp. TaxID=1962975 RepID=UPI003F95369C